MNAFDPVAATLGAAIVASWQRTGHAPQGAQVTLDTNTTLVVPRTAALLEALTGPLEPGVLDGLDVVDLGCGFGAMSLLMAVLGARVTGIDPSEERVSVARDVAQTHALPARFAVGHMQELLLDDHRYDLAVVNNSLCYVIDRDDRRRTLQEARRVLRPRGRLLVRDPNRLNARDQFTGLPLVQLLPPRAAVAAARLVGRRRSLVRLRGPRGMRGDLRLAGFAEVRSLPVRPGRGARWLRAVTGYQHVTGVVPD